MSAASSAIVGGTHCLFRILSLPGPLRLGNQAGGVGVVERARLKHARDAVIVISENNVDEVAAIVRNSYLAWAGANSI